MDGGVIQRIVQRYRSPYTAVGWAFVRALRVKPRPPLPSHDRKPRGRRESVRDIDECRRQAYGVEM